MSGSSRHVLVSVSCTASSQWTPRVQVVFVNYAIMCSISWNLDITFPQPFRTLEDLFSFLELSLLRLMPMGCLAPFDFISDFYFITVTPLALLMLIVLVGAARVKLRKQSVASVFNQHAFAALLLSFIVLPVTSSKIFVRVRPLVSR